MKFDTTSATFTPAETALLLTFSNSHKGFAREFPIMVDPAHGRVVTTNGHTMIIIEGEPAKDAAVAPFCVPRGTLAQVAKAVGKAPLTVSASEIAYANAALRYASLDTEGFPPWTAGLPDHGQFKGVDKRAVPASVVDNPEPARMVLEKKRIAPPVFGIDYRYLEALAVMAKCQPARRKKNAPLSSGVEIRIGVDALDPIVATTENAGEATRYTAVVCPMRVD